MKPLTIGKLAKAANVGLQTVRFYERTGLLPAPTRRTSGYREYQEEDAKRIRFIKRAQELGFTLKEILELLELNTSSKATCSDVKNKTDKKVAEVEAKIKDLQQMRRTLRELSCACGESKQAVKECKILDCFEKGWKC